jgi:hypothetical protein
MTWQAISRTASQGTSDERARDTPSPAPYRRTKMIERPRLQQGGLGTRSCVLGTRSAGQLLHPAHAHISLQYLAVAGSGHGKGGPSAALLKGENP